MIAETRLKSSGRPMARDDRNLASPTPLLPPEEMPEGINFEMRGRGRR